MRIALRSPQRARPAHTVRGSLLIIVMWISFGLVSLALYFGSSMLFEYRAADQNTAGVEAEQAMEGAAKYLLYVLTNTAVLGHMPTTNNYNCEEVAVGESTFWVIGRTNLVETQDIPAFGLVDEASKLNLNTATSNMLMALPRMTPQLAAAIIDWRDTNDDASTDGAESDTYSRLDPPYLAKNAPFESVEELALVYGATTEILYGEDANLNGVLDPNENDGQVTPPNDNHDGLLDPGIFEYVTAYSREPNLTPALTNRVNVNASERTNLNALLEDILGSSRAKEIENRFTSSSTNFTSLTQFFITSQMTVAEFAKVADYLGTTTNDFTDGLINVNTASEVVLRGIPGIGTNYASQLVAYRKSNSDKLYSVAWVVEPLGETNAITAGPYITTRSYQFSADIVAIGHHGRGYRRANFILDTSTGAPAIVYRRDRARLGWALGAVSR
jgi:DNA uptake protein ComE-like DNA-binding protein